MYNNIIFKKIVHEQSGEEFDISFIEEGTFVETLELDGPKLFLTMTDQYSYLRDKLKIKELDTLSVYLTDFFASEGLEAVVNFTILKITVSSYFLKMQLMSTPVYQTKVLATGSKSFVQKPLSGILPCYSMSAGSLLSRTITALPVKGPPACCARSP